MSKQWITLGLLTLALVGGALFAEDRAVDKKDATDPRSNEQMVVRASTIVGMEVRNRANESVGKIDDLVIDLNTGKTRYAAMAVGGFLGIGERLFAVPMGSFTIGHDGNTRHFVLDVNKDRLKAAPGFQKDKWPDFGNPTLGEEIDRYYGVEHRTTAAK